MELAKDAPLWLLSALMQKVTKEIKIAAALYEGDRLFPPRTSS
jgi:hypothetical protein